MLTLTGNRRSRDCDGQTRRDFLQVGTLGTGALALPGLLQSRAHAASNSRATKNTSVIWVWLSGGPTHVETFDPKMTAPVEYRSTTGEVKTNLPGVTLGGNFERFAKLADKMTFVRSFAHTNSGHGGGTHFLMTGYDNRNIDNGGLPSRPSLGSITSRLRGANHTVTGMPTYVRLGSIGSDGPAFLGTAYGPFGTNREAQGNMELRTPLNRVDDRRSLLAEFDRFSRQADASGVMDGLDAFEQQAFNLVLGNAPKAFDLNQEDPRTRERYKEAGSFGDQLLIARRLCEAGCGFVTVHSAGWDMHEDSNNPGIERGMKMLGHPVDKAVSAFLEDLEDRGMLDNVLLVIGGDFGRTPKINSRGGRDHWANLCTLAFAGGGINPGQVIGQASRKNDIPVSDPVGISQLFGTVMHSLFDVAELRLNRGVPRDLMSLLESSQPIPGIV